MSIVLLDTSVASLLHPKKKSTDLRKKYESHIAGKTLALSFQTIAELWRWAEKNNWGQESRSRLDAFVRRFLVIPYDYELAKSWAHVMTISCAKGRRLESGDCWIVATALHRGIPLITHDRDMVDLGIADLDVISFSNARDSHG